MPSSGRPGSLRRPAAPSSLHHATHFSKCFCISSGEPDVFRPRNKYVNSLISRLLLNRSMRRRRTIFEFSRKNRFVYFLNQISSLDTGSVMRARERSDGNDDQSLWSPFPRNEGRPLRIAVRAERATQTKIRVRQVRGIEHHVRREMYDLPFRIRCKVL